MASLTINPSIDQAAKLMFRDNFHALAQQTKSKLVNSGVATFLPSEGKTHNYPRIGRLELAEVATRNPDKQYGDYALDNRQFTKRRFTRTIPIDAKYDINELIKDPTSDILMQLNAAKERVIDRIIVEAAGGAVLVGQPDAAPSSVTAANDGVITIDATAGVTYDTVQEITQNFINNELQYSDFKGSRLCITGAENTDLMSEVEFINNDYIASRPVEKGVMDRVGTYGIEMFAGSVTGGITALNPILEEDTVAGERTCLVLAPQSVVMSMDVALQDVTRSATKVNSYDITIDMWINAMRTEGVRVQKVTTTI